MNALSMVLTSVATLVASASFATAQTPAVPTTVRSTTDQIKQYSPQSRAMTMKALCETLAAGNFESRKSSSVACLKHPNDIVEIKGSVVGRPSVSIFANAADKTVIEYMGDNEMHRYSNDSNQFLFIELSAVNTGVRRTPEGTEVLGYYRLDSRFSDGTNALRVGFFDNLQ